MHEKNKHDFWLKETMPTIMTPGDTLLIFTCRECPRVLPVLGADLVKWSKGGTLPTPAESS